MCLIIFGGALILTVNVVGNGIVEPISNSGKYNLRFFSLECFKEGKGISPFILLSAMEKWQGKLGSFALIRKPIWEKENPKSKTASPRLKTDFCQISPVAMSLCK